MTETETKDADSLRHQHGQDDPDGRDCLHCALHAAFDAWADRQPDETLDPHRVGYAIGQFTTEVLEDIPSEFRRPFAEAHIQAQRDVLVSARADNTRH